MTEPPMIELVNVRFRYREDQPWAVNGVTLRIKPGECLGIAGANGSGKTTLALLLAGLAEPQRGQVKVDGRTTRAWPAGTVAREIGLAFQNPDQQIFSPTVEREIAYGPEQIGVEHSHATDAVERAIQAFDLQELRDTPPATLGLSDRRRVALASVWSMETPVLILDEPNWGLDSLERKRLGRALAKARRAGRSLILITHDMRLVLEHTQRLVVLDDGRVIADGPTAAVLVGENGSGRSGLGIPPALELIARVGRSGRNPAGTSVAAICSELADQLGGRGSP